MPSKIKVKPIDIILSLIPIVSGFVTSFAFKIDSTIDDGVKFSPPPYVFTTVWIILYILIGISWAIANRKNRWNNIPFSLLVASLIAWIIATHYTNKDENNSRASSVILLLVSLMLTIMCAQIVKFILVPLICWLIYALLLLTTKIQISK